MTAAAPGPPDRYRCGAVQIDAAQREVLVNGEPAKLGARAIDVLLALLARRDRVVGKDELFDVVWPGLVVEENNLQVHVSALRKLLGPQAIATIPGRGYRFVAPLDGESAAAPPDGSVAAPRSNLPAHLPPLLGRDADLADVCRLLEQHALVTLAGPGGIGKTRLALAVAHARAAQHADGAWFVDLSTLADGAQLPAIVGHALAIELPAPGSAAATIAAALRAQDLLLVLDNCEHVLDAAAALVGAVHARAPRVRVLATSREPLRVAGEQVVRLEPLALPPEGAELDPQGAARYGALHLFVARAQAADRRFALSHANLPAVAAICRSLDGLPLAIELAAARVPLLGIDGLRERLGDRLRVLTVGGRTAPARQQALRATLEWSHALLAPAEQTVFRRLGVFVGGFSFELAQHVLADAALDDWAVLDHLGALVDKSLVLAEGDAVPRYRLLESTRAFALEQLDAAGETAALRQRHGYALRALVERFDAAVASAPRFDRLLNGIAPELDNLQAALDWACAASGETQTALAIVAASDWLWNEFDQFAEGLRDCRRVLPWLDGAPPRLEARFRLSYAGLGRVAMLPPREWVEQARSALAVYRQLDEPVGLYRTLCLLAGPTALLVSEAEAGALLAEAARIERPDWSPRLRLRRQASLEAWHDLGGRLEAALTAGRQCVALARQAGGVAEIGALSNLADSEFALGRVDDALALCRESIARAAELGRPAAVFHTYSNMVPPLLDRGDLDEAEAAIRASRSLFVRGLGTAFVMLPPLAVLMHHRGRAELAAQLAGCAERLFAADGHLMPPLELRRHQQLLAALEAQLTPARAQALRAEGASWSEDEAFRRAGMA